MFPNSQVKRNPKRQTTMWAYWTFVKMKVNITCHNKNILKGKNRYSCCIFSSTSSFSPFAWIIRQTIPFHISAALWSKVNILIRITLGKKNELDQIRICLKICTCISFSVDITVWSNGALKSFSKALLWWNFPSRCASGLLPYKHELATAIDPTLPSCRRTKLGKASTARTPWHMIEVQGCNTLTCMQMVPTSR